MTIDFDKSEQYTLSIRLSTDGFTFSIFNPMEASACCIFERTVDESLSLTANLKRVFRELEWAGRPFRRVNILLADSRVTFLPLEFFEDEQAETIFYYNHRKRENETVLYNILHRSNTVVVFGMDHSIYTFLGEQYPQAKTYAQASPLLELFSAKSRLGNCRKMYAHLRREAIDVFGYERGRLLLANSFECRETSDRLYYLLYIWKQLCFEQERDELQLAGYLDDKELLLPELRKFIRQVFVMNPATNLDLQAITTCE